MAAAMANNLEFSAGQRVQATCGSKAGLKGSPVMTNCTVLDSLSTCQARYYPAWVLSVGLSTSKTKALPESEWMMSNRCGLKHMNVEYMWVQAYGCRIYVGSSLWIHEKFHMRIHVLHGVYQYDTFCIHVFKLMPFAIHCDQNKI